MPRRKQSGLTSARGAQEPSKLQTAEFDSPGPLHTDVVEIEEPPLPIPPDWNLGALLNVRSHGDYYVTLFPEEFDYRKPERALRFSNYGQCQNFVSSWYARTYHEGQR